MERFQLDHISEVLEKLEQGVIDDEIWGKIIIMERGKRTAKAYLRKTTIIVDGGEDEFDGKTLGFNHFSNSERDEYTEELRSKIGDGVIIKMDNQGNIKAMARGSTPIIVQGWKEPNLNCISERLLREQGKLKTRGEHQNNDEERIAKIFDMRRFKSAVSRELMQPDPDARELLMKTCVRVSLVKDCGSDAMKTPCWFMIINLVALDMLKTKLPQVLNHSILSQRMLSVDDLQLPRIASQATIIPPTTAAEVYSQAALSQIIAAAVQQANTQQLSGSVPALHQIGQIARLASTLALAKPLTNSNNKHEKRSHRRSRSFSDSDDSSSSPNAARDRHRGHSVVLKSNTSSSGSSSGVSAVSVGNSTRREDFSKKSLNAVFETENAIDSPVSEQTKEKICAVNLNAPRLDDYETNVISEQQQQRRGSSNRGSQRLNEWLSCTSTTSDYDSNREPFESGSWSSASRRSSTNSNHQHCESPQIVSESEHLPELNVENESTPIETDSHEANTPVTSALEDSLETEIEKIFEYVHLEDSYISPENTQESTTNNCKSSLLNTPSPNLIPASEAEAQPLPVYDTESDASLQNGQLYCVRTAISDVAESEPKLSKIHESKAEFDNTKKENSATAGKHHGTVKSAPTVSTTTTARRKPRESATVECNNDETVPNTKSEEPPAVPPIPPPPPPSTTAICHQIKLKTKGTCFPFHKQQVIAGELEERQCTEAENCSRTESDNLRSTEKRTETFQKQQTTKRIDNCNRERRVSEVAASISIGKFDENSNVQTETAWMSNGGEISKRCETSSFTTSEKSEKPNSHKRNLCSSLKKQSTMPAAKCKIGINSGPVASEYERRNEKSLNGRTSNSSYEAETNSSICCRTEKSSSRTAVEGALFNSKVNYFDEQNVFARREVSPSSIRTNFNGGSKYFNFKQFSKSSMDIRNRGVEAEVDSKLHTGRHRRPWECLPTRESSTNDHFCSNPSNTQISTDDEASYCSRYRTRWKTQELQPVKHPRASLYRFRSPTTILEEGQCNSANFELPPPGRVAARVSAMEKVESVPVRFRNSSSSAVPEASRRWSHSANTDYNEWNSDCSGEKRISGMGHTLHNQSQRRSFSKCETYYPPVCNVQDTSAVSQFHSSEESQKFPVNAEFECISARKKQFLARPLSMWSIPRANESFEGPYGRFVTETPYGRDLTTDVNEFSGKSINYRPIMNSWQSNLNMSVNYDKNEYASRMLANSFRPLPVPPVPPTRHSSVHVRMA